MSAALHRLEKAVLVALARSGGRLTYEELADRVADAFDEAGIGWSLEHEARVSAVAKTCGWLSEKGYVEVDEEKPQKVLLINDEGLEYAVHGFPERRLVDFLRENDGEVSVETLKTVDRSGIGLMWAKKLGWIEFVKKDSTTYVRLGRWPVPKTVFEQVVEKLYHAKQLDFNQLSSEEIEAVEQLVKRQKIVKVVERRVRRAVLTEEGLRVAEAFSSKPLPALLAEVTRLTSEMLRTGGWRDVSFSMYDVAAATPPVFAAKRHPLNEVVRMVRQTYVEMGFEEIEGPIVELAFWNFDALFQPQDHPAREMQDTFYLLEPSVGDLPTEYVENVKAVHENGGGTGSKGWGYKWSEDEAKRLLLRTHTTATTIRHLAANKTPPIKVFSVDRIFRNEKVDWKHLAEFHQIEGIVVEKGANLRMLMGVLKDFYYRLGLREVRFRPSYFPYTEPSMEVEVRLGGRWLELGGSGIFRPETTHPFGVRDPVLAWGLGLERLAMVIYGVDDIRSFHLNDLKWLRSVSPLQPLHATERV
ncbi:MAG: phenylalanine--tRNA ligase subunit alpha [Candidatus Caldarchaeum sp.]|uniref:Phenylalanine--tRNA ligase alpha subunit n=1 Tax=Caldiarchaeum subterraneum TaxID=311458 RepID=A0A7C5QKD6_CALS0